MAPKAMKAMKALKAKETKATAAIVGVPTQTAYTKVWPDHHQGPFVNWVLQEIIHSGGTVTEHWKGTLRPIGAMKAKKAKTAVKDKTEKAKKAMKVKK